MCKHGETPILCNRKYYSEKGRGSLRGWRASRKIVAGTASRKFLLRVPQRCPGPPATTHRSRPQEQVGVLVWIINFGGITVFLTDSQEFNSHLVSAADHLRGSVNQFPSSGLSLLTFQISELGKAMLWFPSCFEVVVLYNPLHFLMCHSVLQSALSTSTVQLD